MQVNRLRRKIEQNPANPLFVQTVRGIGYRLVAGHDQPRHRHPHYPHGLRAARRSLALVRPIPPIRRIHAVLGAHPRRAGGGCSRWLNSVMPKGLYARALLIIILPMVILQSVIAFVFMERHWNDGHAAAVGRRGARHRRR